MTVTQASDLLAAAYAPRPHRGHPETVGPAGPADPTRTRTTTNTRTPTGTTRDRPTRHAHRTAQTQK